MNRKREIRLLLSCEHGGDQVPAAYGEIFARREQLLRSHRGFDRGALELAQSMARQLRAPLVWSTTTRLLVDLNRSLNHPRLFSIITRRLDHSARQKILERYYYPYRQQVRDGISRQMQRGGRVVHVSVHSFTPILRRQVRQADIGLLYDPSCWWEGTVCRHWQQQLRSLKGGLVVRRNYPYRGAADGLTTALRREFSADLYAGIELELNQRCLHRPLWKQLPEILGHSLQQALAT